MSAAFVRDALAAAITIVCAIACRGVLAASDGLTDTIERVKPAIVAIGTYQKTRSPPFVFRGTGFAVGNGHLVATNAHVLPENLSADAQERLVALRPARTDREPRELTIAAVDLAHDVALLRIAGAALPALDLADAAPVREGETFAFTGFPIGSVLGFVPVTHRGIISAVTPIALPTPTSKQLDSRVIRRVRSGVFPVYQLDATAYPGNSGSPLYDVESGRVVAILNMVFVKSTRESVLSQPSGIAFAIPVEHLRDLLAAKP